MTETAADPRMGALTDLLQGLLGEYTRLATTVLNETAEEHRAELIEQVQKTAGDVQQRISEIAAMATSPAG